MERYIYTVWKVKVKLLSHVWLFVTPWTVAYGVPTSMEFSRQEYWSGLLFPSPRGLPNPGTWVSSIASRWFYHLSHLKYIHIHGSAWFWVDGAKGWKYYLAERQRLFDDCHPGSNEVIYYFSFHFHFYNSNQCWALFPF